MRAGNRFQAGHEQQKCRGEQGEKNNAPDRADAGKNYRFIAAAFGNPGSAGQNVIRHAFVARAEISCRHGVEYRIADDHADAQRDQLHRGHGGFKLQHDHEKDADDVVNMQCRQK